MSQTSFEDLQRMLTERNISFTVLRHRPLFTMDDVMRELNIPQQSAAKTLVVAVTKRGLFRVVLQGSARLDFSKLALLLKVSRKDICFAGRDILAESGFVLGAISPFGGKLPTLIDQLLLSESMVFCGAGDNDKTFSIRPQDIVSVSSALVVDITKNKKDLL